MEIIPANVISEIEAMPKPLIIGISGFGGAGQSTAAIALGKKIQAPIVSVDSFFKNSKDNNYERWEIIDFARLMTEVIIPFRSGKNPIRYGHFDWNMNRIVEEKEVHHDGKIIIEGVGLFRVDLNECLDFKIWIACSPIQATERGKKRDREEHQNPQDELWDGVWKRNDEQYLHSFQPEEAADVIVDNA